MALSDNNPAPKIPVEPGLIARLTNAWEALMGRNDWFGPGTPTAPVVAETLGPAVVNRAMDYPSAVNIRQRPRNTESITFEQMRALSENCDILRTVIETRKDQMSKLAYSIGPRRKPTDPPNKKLEPDNRCTTIEEFLRFPDGEHTWDQWLRMLLEDMFVIDAPTIYPWLNNDGTPYRFDLIDGATIKRVIDIRGRTPAPPLPAYQQILKGVVAWEYNADELVYAPRNVRTHKIYGYSPVEQIIMTVNIAIRRSLHQLQYYTEGSTPDLIFAVPPDWNMQQITDFNAYWQESLSGNTGERRKARFVPNGVNPINTKDQVLKDMYDEWLARVICYAFSVSAQPFIKENNRSTSETAQKMAMEEGLFPIMKWVKGVVDKLIWKYFGYKDLEFKWEDEDSTSPDIQTKIDDTNVKNGTATINEIREKRGDAPVPGGDAAMVYTASGYVPILKPEPDPNQPDPNQPPGQAGQPGPNGDGNEPPPGGGGGGKAPPKGQNGAQGADQQPVKGSTKGDTQKGGVDDGSTAGVYKRFRKSAGARKVKPIDRETPERKDRLDAFAKAVHEALLGQLDTLRTTVVTKADATETEDPTAGIAWQGWDRFEDLFGQQLVLAGKQGVTDAFAQLDLDDEKMLTLANEDAIEYAKTRSAELVGKRVDETGAVVENPNPAYSIEDSTREMIRDDVATAMEQGLSNEELADMLSQNYAFSEERAMTIARTETAGADVMGNMALYSRSGQVDQKEWITGAGCCDLCAEIDGQRVPLHSNFSIGVAGPPAHPSCRCDFLPILHEEPDEE